MTPQEIRHEKYTHRRHAAPIHADFSHLTIDDEALSQARKQRLPPEAVLYCIGASTCKKWRDSCFYAQGINQRCLSWHQHCTMGKTACGGSSMLDPCSRQTRQKQFHVSAKREDAEPLGNALSPKSTSCREASVFLLTSLCMGRIPSDACRGKACVCCACGCAAAPGAATLCIA